MKNKTPCNDGYDAVLNVCWKKCPSGTVDIGALCTIVNKPLTVLGRCYDTDYPTYLAGLCYAKGVNIDYLIKTPNLSPCPDGSHDVVGTCWSKGQYWDKCCSRGLANECYGCLRGSPSHITKNLYQRTLTSCDQGYYIAGLFCFAKSKSPSCPTDYDLKGKY